MMMPMMSGREACMRIRKTPSMASTKVIFLTVAKFSEVGQNILKELGVLDYITKPFSNKDLVARVKKALEAK